MPSFRNIDAEDNNDQGQQEDVSGFVDSGSDTGQIPRPTASENVRNSKLRSVVDGRNTPRSSSSQRLLGQSENVEQLTSDLTVLDEPKHQEPAAPKKPFRFFSRK